MTQQTSIVWLRRDLRSIDNPALNEAAARGAVLPLFIWCPDEEQPWQPGAASCVWLHHSLEALSLELRELGARLIIRSGDALGVLRQVARESGAQAVFWNRCYDPAFTKRDTKIKSALLEQSLEVRSFNAALLNEPQTIANKQGLPFRVFTAYYKHCLSRGSPAQPLPRPRHLTPAPVDLTSLTTNQLALLPSAPWDRGIRESWFAGSAGAMRELDGFSDAAILDYAQDRDRPDRMGVSRLSPHLHFGEISPRQIWHHVMDRHGDGPKERVQAYLRQLYWREFAHHLLFHFPDTTHSPLQPKFSRFPWLKPGAHYQAWCQGRTGYPLVDAGMRELWRTGWMHNRVRMNAASFLVKHLLTDWREGARWFWDTLVDADLANNTMGWQWCAGSGADAAPYFRIFNPVIQGERFDPEGRYVRMWIPQLSALPNSVIHKPWQASKQILATAGIEIGRDYPHPIIDHRAARIRALDALQSIKQ